MTRAAVFIALAASLAALAACSAKGSEKPAAAAGPPTVTKLSVMRPDDSAITAYVERTETPEKQSLLLVLQGSICESVAPDGGDRMDFEAPPGFARLDIEKYSLGETAGLQGDGASACSEMYLRHNTIDQRVWDVLGVVAHLRREAGWWNGKLFLMGTSEGATIAALAGPLMPETRGIVLVNGSIGRPFREGWADAMARSVAAGGGDENAVVQVRALADQVWEEARAAPRWDRQEFGDGNTLKWWASIIDIRPSNQLLLTDAPILLMQADHDEMTPVSSARAVKQQFEAQQRDNLSYVELEGLTHGLRTLDGEPGWAPVLSRIRDWLVATNM